jgi:hypothetical protein
VSYGAHSAYGGESASASRSFPLGVLFGFPIITIFSRFVSRVKPACGGGFAALDSPPEKMFRGVARKKGEKKSKGVFKMTEKNHVEEILRINAIVTTMCKSALDRGETMSERELSLLSDVVYALSRSVSDYHDWKKEPPFDE